LRVAGRQEADRTNAQRLEQPPELVFDDIRQGAGNKKARSGIGGSRALRHQRGKASILALRERCFDAGTRIVEHPHLR
jgi:hypothetical protein